MNVDNVTREEMTVGGLAILLVICLFVLPWFHISVSVGAFSASADFTATDDPDGWLAILGVIAALAVVADLAIEKFSPQTQLPEIGGSRATTRFVLAAISAGFVALKFLFHIHFGDFGWGFYVCVVVTVAFVYFAAQARSAAPAGGSASMRSRPSAPSATPPPPPPTTPPSSTSGGSAPSEPGTGAGTGSGGSTPPPGS